jgi:TRAP-type C4-dicarboxylate transport system permease small subunit
MDAFINATKMLSRAAGMVAAALLVAALVVVCQQVVIRYILGQSTVWQTEFVTYAIVAATFVGSPNVLLLRGHVNVDLVPLALGHRARLVLDIVASTAALLFWLVLVWSSWLLWHEAWASGWTGSTVWAPRLWIVYLPMLVGVALLCLQYVANIAALLTGREMPFGLKPGDTLLSHPVAMEHTALNTEERL